MRNIRNLEPYSEKQRENWKSSKKIEIYEDDSQVIRFVECAVARKNAGEKLYFGMIGDEVAEVVRNGGNYQGNPVVHFVKDGITVVAVAVKGALDLYPQTIYVQKKIEALQQRQMN